MTEDEQMLQSQVVCPTCLHRFTTMDDCNIHILVAHNKQPLASELNEKLDRIIDILHKRKI